MSSLLPMQFADGIIPVSYAIAGLLVLVSLGTGYCLRRRRRRLPAFAVVLEGDDRNGEDAEDAVVTCCGVKSTQRLLSLAVFRTLVAGWFAAILLITIATSDGLALRAYTVQNFVLTVVYFISAAVASWISFSRRNTHTPVPLNARLARALKILIQVELPSAFLLDAVTWTVLLPAAEALGNGYQFINFGSINMHAMNVVALLTDFLINDVTFSVDDIWILMLWVTWYGVFHTCWLVTGHTPVYPFLNPATYTMIVWMVGLVVAHVVSFFMCLGISRLKMRCCRRRSSAAASGYLADPLSVEC